MIAETLRAAANLMRERAEAADGGPWISAEQTHDEWYGLQSRFLALGNVFDKDNAEHIASWDPAVALAVADWLDAEAAAGDGSRCTNCTVSHVPDWHRSKALAVARTYLGEVQ